MFVAVTQVNRYHPDQKTDRRRVIEYFLGPLLQYQAEGLRER